MSANIAACFAFTNKSEGNGTYTNTPGDPGGPTRWGVTLATLSAWRVQHGQPPAIAVDVQNLTLAEATAIFGCNYFNPVGGPLLPSGVDLMGSDFAFNAGAGRSARMIQQAVGQTQDGWVGPATIAAAKAMDPVKLIGTLGTLHLAFYAAEPPAMRARFLRGWDARVYASVLAAKAMLGTATTPPSSLGVAQPPHAVSVAASGVAQPIYATSAHAPMTAPGAVSAHMAAPVQTHAPLAASTTALRSPPVTADSLMAAEIASLPPDNKGA